MFTVYKGEIKYFDESGNLGDPLNGTSNFFVIGLYIEKERGEAEILVEKIKNILNFKKHRILKWHKFNREERHKIQKFFLELFDEDIYYIFSDKRNVNIYGEDLYFNMLYKLIRENNLLGFYKYDGDHLVNMLDKVRVKLKSYGQKTHFTNVETSQNAGIQIADIISGYLQWCLENSKEVEMKNIIKF